MISVLQEKLPEYLKNNLFNIQEFRALFVDRIKTIVDAIQQDTYHGKSLEIELAYIMRDLQSNDIILGINQQSQTLRTTEHILDRE